LILAGGFGTRLRPLSCTRPKILFPIVNKPLLEWTFERLAKNSITEAIMAVNYQTEAALKRSRVPKHGTRVLYSVDPPEMPLGTGGAIKKAERLIGRDAPFLVLNGDIFADVNYTKLLRQREKNKTVATIALHKVEDPSRYGVAELADNGRITSFIEKPSRKESTSNLINAGAYAFSPSILEYIQTGKTVSAEREIFPKLVQEGELCGYVHEGLWTDVGKPEDYLAINRIALESFTTQRESRIQKKAKIKKPVALDKYVSIGEGSTIGPYAALGRSVKVGKGVRVRDSVILPGTVISDLALIEGAIIGEGTVIGGKARIRKGCMLGDHVRIKDNVSLAENVSICPAREISESVLTSTNIC